MFGLFRFPVLLGDQVGLLPLLLRSLCRLMSSKMLTIAPGTAWDRFGPDVTALWSLFEVAFDGGHRDRKPLCDLTLAGSGIDGSQDPEPQRP